MVLSPDIPQNNGKSEMHTSELHDEQNHEQVSGVIHEEFPVSSNTIRRVAVVTIDWRLIADCIRSAKHSSDAWERRCFQKVSKN